MLAVRRLSIVLAVGSALAFRAFSVGAATSETSQNDQDDATTATAAEPDLPSVEVRAAYRDVVTRAISEFDARHFAEARALFLRAHELWPSARTLRTLGMTAFELRLYPVALSELEAALVDARRPLPAEQRTEVRALVERTRAFVGRYRVQVSPPGASLLVDGAPASPNDAVIVLAVGEHEIIARAPGNRELRRAIVVQGREDAELVLVLEPLVPGTTGRVPSPLPSPRPPLAAPRARPPESGGSHLTPAIVAFGVGAAGLVTAGVFSILTLRDKDALDGKCPDRVCPPPYHATNDEMHAFATVATVGAIAGVLGAGVGTYFILTGTPKRERATQVTTWIGPGSLGVSGRF